jgi:hypothetical protein
VIFLLKEKKVVKRKLPIFITCIITSLIFANAANAVVMTVPNNSNDNHRNETREINRNYPTEKRVIVQEPRRIRFERHEEHNFRHERVIEIERRSPKFEIKLELPRVEHEHWRKERHHRYWR